MIVSFIPSAELQFCCRCDVIQNNPTFFCFFACFECQNIICHDHRLFLTMSHSGQKCLYLPIPCLKGILKLSSDWLNSQDYREACALHILTVRLETNANCDLVALHVSQVLGESPDRTPDLLLSV